MRLLAVSRMNWSRRQIFALIFVVASFIGTAAVFAIFFNQLPVEGTSLGIDLIFYAMRGWDIQYDVVNGLRNPPWSVLVLMPLAQLPDKAAWGLLVFALLVVLILSVPVTGRKGLYWLGILLLATAFPTMRVIADAQLEALLIGGLLLVYLGYKHTHNALLAAGLILSTLKPQAVFMLLLALAIYLVTTWDWRQLLRLALALGVVIIPTMLWRGREWLAAVGGTYQAGTVVDASLAAALNRLGFVPSALVFLLWGLVGLITLWIALKSHRTLSREKMGFLIAASLLLAPYTGGNTILVVLAIGAVPLMFRRFWIGLGLFVMADAYYPFNSAENVNIYAYYWTAFLLLSWGVLAADIYRCEIGASSSEMVEAPTLKEDPAG